MDRKGAAIPATDQRPTERGFMSAAISNAVVRLTREYTGRGPDPDVAVESFVLAPRAVSDSPDPPSP